MKPSTRRFDPVTILLSGILLAFVVAEFLWAPHKKPVFVWHHVPGFMAFIGVASCIVVVLLSKLLGKVWLQRPEVEGDD